MSHNTESIFKVVRRMLPVEERDSSAKAATAQWHGRWSVNKNKATFDGFPPTLDNDPSQRAWDRYAASRKRVQDSNAQAERRLTLADAPYQRRAGPEHKAAMRDQSEDRPQPRFLVAGTGVFGAALVLRASDLKVIGRFNNEPEFNYLGTPLERATRMADHLERNYAVDRS